MLAAATAIEPGQSFIDLGCGVGAVGLCLKARVPALIGQGIELDPWLARLAAVNGLEARQGDIRLESPPLEQQVDWVLSNPPFFPLGAGRASPNAQRQAGRQGNDLAGWVRAAMAWVRPRGRIGFVLSSTQVPEAMAALQPAFGGIVLKPLIGKEGAALAERCLLFARQGSRSPFVLATPLVIRDEENALTHEASGLLASRQAMAFPPVK